MCIDISGNNDYLPELNDCIIEGAYLVDPDDIDEVYMHFDTDTDSADSGPDGGDVSDSGNDSDWSRCSDTLDCPCFTGGVCLLIGTLREGLHDEHMAMSVPPEWDHDADDPDSWVHRPPDADDSDWRDDDVWHL